MRNRQAVNRQDPQRGIHPSKGRIANGTGLERISEIGIPAHSRKGVAGAVLVLAR